MANSVDADETAGYQLSQLDIHYLQRHLFGLQGWKVKQTMLNMIFQTILYKIYKYT